MDTAGISAMDDMVTPEDFSKLPWHLRRFSHNPKPEDMSSSSRMEKQHVKPGEGRRKSLAAHVPAPRLRHILKL